MPASTAHNEYQGNPPGMKFSPRIGAVYSINPKTVIRSGFGVYWAPWNYQAVGAANYGNVGFTQQTFISQGQFIPTTNLTNPFPSGLTPIRGNTRGALEGVGAQIEFIDQDKTAPYIISTRLTSRASFAATWPSASNTSARPAGTSASVARTTASSTSTRCRRSICRSGRP